MSARPIAETTQKSERNEVSMQDRSSKHGCLSAAARRIALGVVAAVLLLVPASASAEFELENFGGWVNDNAGQPLSQAGAHPNAFTTFQVGSAPDGYPAASIKDAIVDLPPGFAVNPRAIPQCTTAQLVGSGNGEFECDGNQQAGSLHLTLNYGSPFTVPMPLYNLTPNPGSPGRLGVNLFGVIIEINAEVRPGDYGITAVGDDTPQSLPLQGVGVELWGVPADPVHDAARWCSVFETPCSATVQPKPMVTNPTSCPADALVTKMAISSWEDPDHFERVSFDEDLNGNPFQVTGCDQVGFDGSLSLQSTEAAANSPTGTRYTIDLAQNDDPAGLGMANLRNVELEMPEGLTVNPSSANGLETCSEDEIGLGEAGSPSCPDASKIGTVSITTPVLEEKLEGSVYLAEQGSNPFNSLLALYAVAEGQGVVIKLPGKISPDESTGRLTATFDDNPQLPFSRFVMDLKSGPRAALSTPVSCGTYETTASLIPWSAADPSDSAADEQVVSTSSFEITSGPGGTPCAASAADRPFNPQMKAGSLNPTAGSTSPFVTSFSRSDADQEIASISLTAPEGVSAYLRGIPQCSDQQAQAGSCPEESKIGTSRAAAGVGSLPYWVDPGSVYLAGPYKGAPLTMLIEVPAQAGPLDLGEVLVRAQVHVDPRTAQISVISDPIPQIMEGIPLKTREIRINVDRSGFMTTPTDCTEKQIEAQIQGSHGKSSALTNRFQVGDCASLGFSPDLDLSFGSAKKNTKPNSHPPLNASLSFNEGDSNISSVEVALPKGVLLDQARLGRICSRANYAAESCPEESQVGYAKATTPLLEDPVEGPVYLKASDNPLPDLAADLNGQIDIDLLGRIDQKENKKGLNQIRNTFDVVPDVPVGSFELTLEGGSDGLLVNSRNICKSKSAQKVSIHMRAHNDMRVSERPLIGSACKGKGKKKLKKRTKGKKGKRHARGVSLALEELGR